LATPPHVLDQSAGAQDLVHHQRQLDTRQSFVSRIVFGCDHASLERHDNPIAFRDAVRVALDRQQPVVDRVSVE